MTFPCPLGLCSLGSVWTGKSKPPLAASVKAGKHGEALGSEEGCLHLTVAQNNQGQ